MCQVNRGACPSHDSNYIATSSRCIAYSMCIKSWIRPTSLRWHPWPGYILTKLKTNEENWNAKCYNLRLQRIVPRTVRPWWPWLLGCASTIIFGVIRENSNSVEGWKMYSFPLALQVRHILSIWHWNTPGWIGTAGYYILLSVTKSTTMVLIIQDKWVRVHKGKYKNPAPSYWWRFEM